MITTTVQQGVQGTQLPSNSSSGSSAYSMQPSDFIKLMVTQLENQDPTNPTSDSDLMSQMSDIGQLESSTQMQSSIASSTLQSQVGSASALIGKTVTGIDAANKTVTGTVDSVSVAGTGVTLNLHSGDTVAITNVSSIAAGTTPTTTSTAAPSGT